MHSSLSLIALLLGFAVRAQPAPPADVVGALDRYVRAEMEARHIPGLALAVVRGDSVVYARGYGFADLAHRVLATDSTAFVIASITKTFTAVAVLSLVEEGRVALDDPIGRRVADLPEAWRGATVRQLLQHTSGINSFNAHDAPPCPSGATLGPGYTTRDALAEVACLPLDFAPGTDWSYSDSGYLLLGLLLETVSGQTYEGPLENRIFAPLGMTSTRLLDAGAVVPRLARGYTWEDGAFRNGPELIGAVEFSTGGLVSTVHDLARWAAALGSPRLLQAATWAEAWTPAPVGEAVYGMGFALRPVEGRRHVGHTGGGPSAATTLSVFPDDGLAVIVLTNADQPPFTIRDVGVGVARLFLD